MIYDIRHVTSYSYESAVSFARCSLRLEPRNGDGQTLISHSVDIRPRPAERNRVSEVPIMRPDELSRELSQAQHAATALAQQQRTQLLLARVLVVIVTALIAGLATYIAIASI